MTRVLISSIWTIVSSLGEDFPVWNCTWNRDESWFTWILMEATHTSHTSHTGAFAVKSWGFAMIFWHEWHSKSMMYRGLKPPNPMNRYVFLRVVGLEKRRKAFPKRTSIGLTMVYGDLQWFWLWLLPALFPAMLKSAGMHFIFLTNLTYFCWSLWKLES